MLWHLYRLLIAVTLTLHAIQAEPCVDSEGRPRADGTFYYGDPVKRCIIYRCTGGQQVFQQNRCDLTSRMLNARRIAKLFHDEAPPTIKPVTPPATTPADASPAPIRALNDRRSPPIRALFTLDAQTAPLTATCTAYNGRRYYEGDTWWETLQTPCVQYICKSGQSAVNYTVSCPPLDSQCSTENVFGECCPRQTNCPTQLTGCRASSGAVIADGALWWETAERPCRRYLCLLGTATLVQQVSCPPLPAGCEPKYTYGECCPTCVSAVPTCVDDRNQTRPEGSTWWEEYNRPCKQFTCRGGRKTLIQTISCEPLDPLCTAQLVFGECCPRQVKCRCVEHDAAGGAPVLRSEGEQWPAPNDPTCVIRTCSGGEITERRRVSPDCLHAGCVYDGVRRPHGAEWKVDACTTARCVDGQVSTRSETCGLLPSGCTPVFQPDQCCPTCQQQTHQPCIYGGQVRAHGSEWEVPSLCARARCLDGLVRFEPIVCPTLPPDCVPTSLPNQCCPTCQPTAPSDLPCEFEGKTYQHNDTWTTKCGAFLCNNGQVIAQYVPCEPAPGASCAPIEVPDSCCVRWSCKDAIYTGLCIAERVLYRSTTPKLCYRPGPAEGACSKTDKTVPHGCCPVYSCAQGCKDKEGNLHEHGTSWVVGCTRYQCNNGQITAELVTCPDPPNEQCRVVGSGPCCPEYACGCEGDHPDGDVWILDCRQFSCTNGTVSSEPVPCPEPPREDCVAQLPPGACCPEHICDCEAVTCLAPPPADLGCVDVGTTPDGCCRLFDCPQDCIDELGRVHEDGSEWFIDCTKYMCSDGDITAAPVPCPPPPQPQCQAVYLNETDCCPIYDCPPAGCTPGETFYDGCRVCQCGDDGQFVCPLVFCEETACNHSTGVHQHGESWRHPQEPCLSYVCSYGRVLSTITVCPAAPGPRCEPQLAPDSCCPEWVCSEDPCSENATDVTWEDDCNTCACGAHGVYCTEHLCPKQCQVNGATYETGETILGDHLCDSRTCIDGAVVPSHDACRTKPFPDCEELPVGHYGRECCPFWSCPRVPNIPGDGACELGQIHQAGCLFCQCSPLANGTRAVVCTKRDCVHASCIDESGTEREHGSVWLTPNPCKPRACIHGELRDLEIQCNPPPNDTCVAVREEDRCCPTYVCGAACKEGDVWTVDCNECRCQHGAPVCTDRNCDACEHGTTWMVECNECRCDFGVASCGQEPCQGGRSLETTGAAVLKDADPNTAGTVLPSGGDCPEQQLPLVGAHDQSPCKDGAECDSPFQDCCNGTCKTINNKPGTCAPLQSSAITCELGVSSTCQEDHQCPGAYKCCHLSVSCGQDDSPPLKVCANQSGEWIDA